MKIPSKIKVGNIHYTVSQQPFVEIDDDRNYQGVCDYRKARIEVLDSLNDERKSETFIHELTHAIFYEAGFEGQDEDMVNRVGKVLYQVIKENNFDSFVNTKDGRVYLD